MGVLSEIGDESWLDVIHDKPWGSEDKHFWVSWSLCMNLPKDFQSNVSHKMEKEAKFTNQLKSLFAVRFYSKLHSRQWSRTLEALMSTLPKRFPRIRIHGACNKDIVSKEYASQSSHCRCQIYLWRIEVQFARYIMLSWDFRSEVFN